ncbi:bifunctional hydroxymethylpyrimidine kinase/phosphomethylpyrimidine kinase [Mechercharimyces sp. CAU 1602]|uniref:bifunctional hydroxymethylpyrimidine kinase/phosphomethylpyrimidine kinase n=1 Tax=Mechercharimyces sp. CAU 1602 TaxID=2973933 RepID=UPI0021618D26|nr:bifunctional hydroxymethylpyrimidine kinase/phosphomethylpyrimidine kinase [Mechercharimyces sp. CAU 1602]MCS1351560.1 bifunctional hydroxymethylpyrimidine kinase/phosphomethylpyrimidine kinase [Mechercharimyces sp. CAU 1602]
MSIARALTIAGSDSGGGAGIQADLKTFQELDVFGMSAITAVTAQNTETVTEIYELPPKMVQAQIEAVASDIGIDAVKTGMIANSRIIEAVAGEIIRFRLPRVVVDPVMIAKSGDALLAEEAKEALIDLLIPLATLITPNIPEAEALTGRKIKHWEEVKEAAHALYDLGAGAVLIKGGHWQGELATDLLFDGKKFYTFTQKRYTTIHTHGTGCTLSAAITAQLARKQSLSAAVQLGKDFITAAISSPINIGKGHGPTNHWAYQQRKEEV